jgi:hypothetical protein
VGPVAASQLVVTEDDPVDHFGDAVEHLDMAGPAVALVTNQRNHVPDDKNKYRPQAQTVTSDGSHLAFDQDEERPEHHHETQPPR